MLGYYCLILYICITCLLGEYHIINFTLQVVCEELDWIPFYPGNIGNLKQSHGHKSKKDPPNAEAIPQVLEVCSYWMQSFIKYSKWLENHSNVKAAKFLSKG